MIYSVWHHRRRHAALRLLSLAFLVLLAGCSYGTSDTGDGDETAGPSSVNEGAGLVVKFSHTYFDPSELTISGGDIVVFRNLEPMSHPLLSQQAGLDTGAFPEGQRSFTFDQPGTYIITNTAHGTTMTIVVQ